MVALSLHLLTRETKHQISEVKVDMTDGISLFKFKFKFRCCINIAITNSLGHNNRVVKI